MYSISKLVIHQRADPSGILAPDSCSDSTNAVLHSVTTSSQTITVIMDIYIVKLIHFQTYTHVNKHLFKNLFIKLMSY